MEIHKSDLHVALYVTLDTFRCIFEYSIYWIFEYSRYKNLNYGVVFGYIGVVLTSVSLRDNG